MVESSFNWKTRDDTLEIRSVSCGCRRDEQSAILSKNRNTLRVRRASGESDILVPSGPGAIPPRKMNLPAGIGEEDDIVSSRTIQGSRRNKFDLMDFSVINGERGNEKI